MVDEGYAGARFINKMVFNLWGWEATLPESVSDNDWNQIYDTYVMDKYRLDIKERFKKSGNLYAYPVCSRRSGKDIGKRIKRGWIRCYFSLMKPYGKPD